MSAPVIQFKRGQFANLPALRAGEPGFTTDSYDLYVGINSTTNGNKFFGSHRYWTKETTTTGSGVNLVEGTNNGSNIITLKAPNNVTSDVTYTFPGAAVDGGYLRVDSTGKLAWESALNATGVSTAAFLQATTVNVSAAATIPTLSGTTATFTNITANGGLNGNLNATGVSTVTYLQNTNINSTGIHTASSFSGSGSGLSAGTVPILALDIDGGTSAASVAGTDLFIIDSGANGTNRKVTAQQVSQYVLGGSGGATLPALLVTGLSTFSGNLTASAGVSGNFNATGVSTAAFLQATNVNASGIVTASSFVGPLTGNSSTATTLQNSRNFSASGDATASAVSFNGASNVDLALTLASTGVSAGTYGSQTQVPVVTVDAKGRVTSVSTAAVGTALTVTGDSGSEQINLLSEALSISGGTNLTSVASNNGVVINLDNDINLTTITASQVKATGIVTASSFSGSLANTLTLGTSGTGLSGSTTFNNSGAATFTVTSNATSANTVSAVVARDASGNFSAGTVTAALTGNVTGNINSTGISTASFLQASTVNASGIVTAASFRGTDIRKTDGSLIPLVGVNSASGNAGLVTSFKFTGTGLDSFSVVNGVANISYTGVAATTYTTSQTIVATEGQTSFTVSAGYQQGYVDVYLNGIRLISGVDYTAQDPAGSVVTLASGATLNDELEFVTWKSLGDVVNIANLKTTGNLTVTGFTTTTNTFRSSGGAVLSGVTTANSVQVTDLNSTGIVTASSFSGALANTLTLGTSGTGLSGSTTFNNSGAATFTVTSNATSANTSSAVVARDASGNFSAGTVTAALTGNVTGNVTGNLNSTGVSTVTYLQNTNINSTGIHTAATFSGSLANTLTLNTSGTGLSGSTTFNNSGAATFTVTSNATSANTASAVVARDASGNFSAGTITANLTGTASNVTTNANLTGDITSVGNATSIAAGVIVDADINASAAIADTKLATIATAGKVSNSATTATSSNTASAIVARDASGNFSAGTISATDITLTGNLTVNGTTTQVNTTTLTIEDNLVEFGKIDNAAPTTTTTVDLGLIFHYFTGSAKKSSIFWDQSASRMVLASEMTEGSSPSVVNATTYAALEIGSLWLNDCAGQQQVISCSGTTRSLNDITIDGGSF
jgi:hypothetical protein